MPGGQWSSRLVQAGLQKASSALGIRQSIPAEIGDHIQDAMQADGVICNVASIDQSSQPTVRARSIDAERAVDAEALPPALT
jgi:hypothetical protein